jgi:hypothetical protein
MHGVDISKVSLNFDHKIYTCQSSDKTYYAFNLHRIDPLVITKSEQQMVFFPTHVQVS